MLKTRIAHIKVSMQVLLLLVGVIFSGQMAAQNTADTTFAKQSRQFIFTVNNTELKSGDAQWVSDSLSHAVRSLGKNGFVIARAAASPEGSYTNNIRLANERRQAPLSILNKMGVETSKIKFDVVAEDWDMVITLMQLNGDADTTLVKSMWMKANKNEVSMKRMMKAYNNGIVWNRLTQQYFPFLRAVRFMVINKEDNELVYSLPKSWEATAELEGFEDLTLAQDTFKADLLPIEADTQADEEEDQTYPILSVKTNLLYDLLYTPQTGFQPSPNVELEYYFRNGRWSVLAEMETPWWSNEDKHEYFQYQNFLVEPRFYFKKDHFFTGHFVGVYAHYNRYDFALKGNDGSGVQGEGAGIGLSYGYVMSLGKKETSRWKLEFNVKFGYYESHYDPYDYDSNESGVRKYYYRYYGDSNNFVKRNWRYRWFGPTGVGVSLSYDLFRGHRK